MLQPAHRGGLSPAAMTGIQFALVTAGSTQGLHQVRVVERRRYMRTRLRLAISKIAPGDGVDGGRLWTSNVSAGGMYFSVRPEAAGPLGVGAEVSFELAVPPGAGYSSRPGTIRGAGRVVRTEQVAPQGAVGVAMCFAAPVSIQFPPVGL